VPDSNRDFRLDPKSRPAGELAWHLTSSDVQMLDEIADHKFEWPSASNKNPGISPTLSIGTKQISCARRPFS